MKKVQLNVTLLDFVRFLILLSFYHVKRKYCRNDLNHFWINLWCPKFFHQINAIPSRWSLRVLLTMNYSSIKLNFKSSMKTVIDWMIFVLTKFLPIIMLIFHLLSKLFLPLATTRHSQSQFSINNTVPDNNMKEESIVAIKHIIDHVKNKRWCNVPLN